MKKQILILTVFVAAILVGMNSYGQTNAHYDGTAGNGYLQYLDKVPDCIAPTPLSNCDLVDELHPNPGVEYTYIVNTTNATDDVRWFVVNNFDLIDDSQQLVDNNNQILPRTDDDIDPGDGNGSYILSVIDRATTYNLDADGATTAGITSDGTIAHSITMSWKYFSGLTTANEAILLVAYVESEDRCNDNIVVYRIIPQPAFTLDVAVLSQSGDSVADRTSTEPYFECVSPIESAIYNPGTGTIGPDITPGDSLIVDYGENWVYFMVTAANYVDSWLPNFFIEYNSGGNDYEALVAEWAYAADAAAGTGWNTISNWADSTQATGYESTAVIAAASAAAAGTIGAGAIPTGGHDCIVVRVRLDWGTQYEHDDAVRSIHFEVDGLAYDGAGTTAADGYENPVLGDLHDGDCTIDRFGGLTHDGILYNITPRPEVENAVGGAVDTELKTGDEQ
ncbi:hypothetical protein [Draconibacterium mangrovi]|uniref:hypothetical protein n=1 Tax=Draconibacterium mangrovi TaxID=2697469 RepID=UPI0013D146C4|nr:hypothetical protein [Draconibacterium mangrovi]